MPTPSLLIVPARFKTGRLYSQIPTSGAGDFTVTRNTEARRFNSAGLLESVASGIPRLDYYTSGGTAGCPALLVEPAATNLSFNSADFTASGTWTSGANTISANVTATLDPAGTNTAEKIIPTAVSTTHFISSVQSIAITSGTTYTLSVFAKAGGYDFLRVAFSTEIMPASNRGASFNLTSGTVGDTQAGVTARIENYGNGWYRCSISRAATISATPSSPFFFNSQNSDSATSVTFTGDGTSGAFLWGAQLETGSVATSYIPTTAGTGSRSADVISVSGAVSGSIGQTEGTIYAEVDLKNKGVSLSRVIYLSDGTSNNEIRISHSVTTAGDLQIAIRLAGSLVVNQTSPTAVYFGINKIAVGYKVGTNEVVMYVNGSQIILSTSSGNMPACNTIHLGSQLGTSNFLNDRIRAAALYTTRLTNAELATLTTP